ncbi:hypothetical protein ANAPC5_01220 [Anaplasma phagocytophilum]|nr:hypothetical protein ANAPC5_01220 [Anaplasma phagocytophilum]
MQSGRLGPIPRDHRGGSRRRSATLTPAHHRSHASGDAHGESPEHPPQPRPPMAQTTRPKEAGPAPLMEDQPAGRHPGIQTVGCQIQAPWAAAGQETVASPVCLLRGPGGWEEGMEDRALAPGTCFTAQPCSVPRRVTPPLTSRAGQPAGGLFVRGPEPPRSRNPSPPVVDV